MRLIISLAICVSGFSATPSKGTPAFALTSESATHRLGDHVIAVQNESSDAEQQKIQLFLSYFNNLRDGKVPREQRVEVLTQALALEAQLKYWRKEWPDRQSIRVTLNTVLCGEYVMRRGSDHKNRAIKSCKTALEYAKRDDPNFARAQMFLGRAYSYADEDNRFTTLLLERHIQKFETNEADGGNIEKALAAFHEAFSGNAFDNDRMMWAVGQDWLGWALQRRTKGNKEQNIEEAIKAHNSALRYWSPTNHPIDWASVQKALGEAYEKREVGGREANDDIAIQHYESALTVISGGGHDYECAETQYRLANLYAKRRNADHQDISKAISAVQASLAVFSKAATSFEGLAAYSLLGHLFLQTGEWSNGQAALNQALAIYRRLYRALWSDSSAILFLNSVADSTLFTDSAYAAAAIGEAELAFTLLNEGQARLLRMYINIQSNKLPPELREKAQRSLAIMAIKDRAASEAASNTDKQRSLEEIKAEEQALKKLVPADDAIRAEKGDKDTLNDVLPEESAIAAPIISVAGGKIMVAIKHGGRLGLQVIDVPALTSDKVQSISDTWGRGYIKNFQIAQKAGELGHLVPASSAYQTTYNELQELWRGWFGAIEAATNELEPVLIAPLTQALEKAGLQHGARLVLMLPGGLTALPVASANLPESKKGLSDLYAVTFVPNLDALRFTNDQARIQRKRSLSSIINPTKDLRFAALEGALVASHFPPTERYIGGEDEGETEGLGFWLSAFDHSYWHFATHGAFFPENPARSGLIVSRSGRGAMISLRSMERTLAIGSKGPRLVVLSACETGVLNSYVGDYEFTGLPGVFIRRGAAGVLATRWPVDDRATALLMAKFYDFHLDNGLAPPEALRQAQNWLRQATWGEIDTYIRDAVRHERLSATMAEELQTSLRRGSGVSERFLIGWKVIQNLISQGAEAVKQGFEGGTANSTPFAHPYYWAAFYYTGN